jgi:hypothetical protein
LRSISAHRKYQERFKEKNEAPEEIRNGKGVVWWIRNGKPSLEEYSAMGFEGGEKWRVRSTLSASHEPGCS